MGPSVGLIFCGKLAVMQASLFDGFSYDPLALFDDGCASSPATPMAQI